jgi:DNA-binding phage protein
MTRRKPTPPRPTRPRPPLDPALVAALESAIAAEGVAAIVARTGLSRSTLHRVRRGGAVWATTAARIAEAVTRG